jgi:hypothetical protein
VYHYDPETALEELREDAVLPNPVHLRDMILRRSLSPDEALELNRQFLSYQKLYSEAMATGRDVLQALAEAAPKK